MDVLPTGSGLAFTCPVCLDTKYRAVLDDDYRQCYGCSLILQTRPPIDPAGIYRRANYDDRRTTKNNDVSVFSRFHHDFAVGCARLDQLGDSVPGIGHGPWVDYGCGSCGFLAAARRRGYGVAGVEADPLFCAELSQLSGIDVVPAVDFLLDRVSIRCCRPAVLSFFDVLEHLLDPVCVLSQVAPRVQDGGALVIEVPDVSTVSGDLSAWKHYKPDEHLTHWSHESLSHLLNLCLKPFHEVHVAAPVPGKLQVVWRRRAGGRSS
jgi:SAM-dependent methyltransferase